MVKNAIEHRLYEIEFSKNKNTVDRKLICMTESRASWYALYGYRVFDFNESLDMEPFLYDNEQEMILEENQNEVY